MVERLTILNKPEKQTIKASEKPQKLNPLRVSSKNINMFKTRKLSTVVKDLAHFCHANEAAAAKILLARGVAALYRQKSNLARTSASLKDQTRDLNKLLASMKKPSKNRVKSNKDLKSYYLILGELNATVRMRRVLNSILTQKGIQLPNDKEFNKFLQIKSKDLIKEIKQ